MKPLVSIVLPIYNGSRYLDEAVESVFAQTYSHWQLIIVDDASTDDTPAKVARIVRRNARVRTIRHAVNRKLPAALNTGLSAAEGKYLSWTSDDNRYLPTAVEEMVDFLESHPEAALVYADQVTIDETGRRVGPKPVGEVEQLGLGNCIGACFLFRRGVLDVIGGYREDLFLAEDYEFWLRLASRFGIAPLHKTLYEYRCHGGSLTSQQRGRILSLTEQVVTESLPRLSGADRVLRANLRVQLANLAQARDDGGAARQHVLAAMKQCPLRTARHLPSLLAAGLLGGGVRWVVAPVYRGLFRRGGAEARRSAST